MRYVTESCSLMHWFNGYRVEAVGIIEFKDGEIWFDDDAALLEPEVYQMDGNRLLVKWAYTESMVIRPELSDFDVMQMMHSNMQSNCFIQSPLIGNVPNQGWKLHFSANSYADYQKMLYILIPELQRLGLNFKVVRPSAFQKFACGDGQDGKFFTVYLNDNQKFLSNLSEKARNVLFQTPSIPVKELFLGGKVFGRYGAFTGNQIFLNGKWVFDDRKVMLPLGVPVKSLNDF